MNLRAIALLTMGHCLIDLAQGLVAALVPYFVMRHHLSYAAGGGLVLASSLASSIVQPVFGHYADRESSPWLLPLAVMVAVAGLIAAALTPSYLFAIVALAVSGLGVAAFHPEAARLVHFAAGKQLTTAMSYFSVGGGLGYAAAPLLVANLSLASGMPEFPLLLAPAFVLAGLFWMEHQRHAALVRQHESAMGGQAGPAPAQWRAFALLGLTMSMRSAVFTGFNSFLALYWERALGQPPAQGQFALAVLLGSSLAGTLLGGRVADCLDRRGVLCLGLFVSAGLFALLGATAEPAAAMLLLVPTGIIFALASSPLIVLGQQYLPGRIGAASGVTLGLAVSCGGAAPLPLGRAADAFGIGIIPSLLACICLAAAVLALLLPRPRAVH
jgi:MFS transporter, FSR family, fosmidomycin resistance protein